MAPQKPVFNIKVSNNVYKLLKDNLAGYILAVVPHEGDKEAMMLVDAQRFAKDICERELPEGKKYPAADIVAENVDSIVRESRGMATDIGLERIYSEISDFRKRGMDDEMITSRLVVDGCSREIVEYVMGDYASKAHPVGIMRIDNDSDLENRVFEIGKRYGLADLEIRQLQAHLKKGDIPQSILDSVGNTNSKDSDSADMNRTSEFEAEYMAVSRRYKDALGLEDFYEKMVNESEKKRPVVIVAGENGKLIFLLNMKYISQMKDFSMEKMADFSKRMAEVAKVNEKFVQEYYLNLGRKDDVVKKTDLIIDGALDVCDLAESGMSNIDANRMSDDIRRRKSLNPDEIILPMKEIVETLLDPMTRNMLYGDTSIARYFRGGTDENGVNVKGALEQEERGIEMGRKLIRIGQAKKIIAKSNAKSMEALQHELADGMEEFKHEISMSEEDRPYFKAVTRICETLLNDDSAIKRFMIEQEAEDNIKEGEVYILKGEDGIGKKVNPKFIVKAIEECPSFKEMVGALGIDFQLAVETIKVNGHGKNQTDSFVDTILANLMKMESSVKDDDELFIEYLAAYKAIRLARNPDIGSHVLMDLERKIKELTCGLDPAMFHFPAEDKFYAKDLSLVELRFNEDSMTKEKAKLLIDMANRVYKDIMESAETIFTKKDDAVKNGKSNGGYHANEKKMPFDVYRFIDSVQDPNEKIKYQRRLFYIVNRVIDSYLNQDVAKMSEGERDYLKSALQGGRNRLHLVIGGASMANAYLNKARAGLTHSTYTGSEPGVKEELKKLRGITYSGETNGHLEMISEQIKRV